LKAAITSSAVGLYAPDRDYRYIEINRHIRQLRAEMLTAEASIRDQVNRDLAAGFSLSLE
jgi:hypothetical protein